MKCLSIIIAAGFFAFAELRFAQEFVPLNVAMFAASGLVLIIIAIRAMTIMSRQLALAGVVFPAAALLTITLVAATHTRLQGILITTVGLALFIVAMLLIPRMQIARNIGLAQGAARA